MSDIFRFAIFSYYVNLISTVSYDLRFKSGICSIKVVNSEPPELCIKRLLDQALLKKVYMYLNKSLAAYGYCRKIYFLQR